MTKKIKKVEEPKVEEPKVDVPKEEIVPEVQSEIIPDEPKTYLGKKVISEKTSLINEKEYISLTLEDGSVCQISETEYKERVK